MRIGKTLQDYLLSYWTAHKLTQFIMDKIGIKRKYAEKKLYPDRMAINNYKENVKKAYAYCKNHNIQFVIIRLPSCPIDSTIRPFIQKLEMAMKELSNFYSIPFINANSYYRKNKIFCVGNHQDLKGHQETAKYFKEKLKNIVKVTNAADLISYPN